MIQANEHSLIKSIARRSPKITWVVFHSEIITLAPNIHSHFTTSNIYLNTIGNHPKHPQPAKIFSYIAQDYLWHHLPDQLKQNHTWQTWWQNRQDNPPGNSIQMIDQHTKHDAITTDILRLYRTHVLLCMPSLTT